MKMRLKSKEQELGKVFTFRFEPEEQISWQPGQYMHYELQHENPDDRGSERWFTIASAPYEKEIRITTRFDGEKVSSFKQALLNMKPADEIIADGPKGSFVLREGEHHHVFIAGGIGITPFRSMILQLAHDNNEINIDLLYANRDENFVFERELKNVQNSHTSFHIIEFVNERIKESDFKKYLSDESAVYYLSGPRSMVENYELLLADIGVDKTAVMTDYFPGY